MATLKVSGMIVCSYGEASPRKFANKFIEYLKTGPSIEVHKVKALMEVTPEPIFDDPDYEDGGGVFGCMIDITGAWVLATKKEVQEAYNKFIEQLNADGWGLWPDETEGSK